MAVRTTILASRSRWTNWWRIRALLRRPGLRKSVVIAEANLQIDTAEREVRFDGKVVEVPRREYYALELLMRRTGSVVSKKSMEDWLYSFGEEIASNAVEVLIHRLRKRLLDSGAEALIHAIRGVGYMLAAGPAKAHEAIYDSASGPDFRFPTNELLQAHARRP